jgi:glucose/arabinose dehydrogenase
MALGPNQDLYVGTMDEGVVYHISSKGKVSELLKNLKRPQGVLWHEGHLYVAEIHRISKVRVDVNPPVVTTVREFPDKMWHGWKTIQIGPDGKMYVPIGAPCNVCDEKLPFMAIHRMNVDGSNFETVATGIRNTVGYTWHPESKELYFNEMGRDQMGDDVPPDELNVIRSKNPHFGFPYVHGKNIPDPQFGKLKPKSLSLTPPLLEIQAHSAPIGIAFFPKEEFPAEFHNCFLIAEHGSWNRSKKSGYQVSKGCLKAGQVVSYTPFITGFKQGEKALARPVHFLFLKDRSFYLSEDEPGTILKISYQP